jgi:F-type H+-transporting ATPase subunit gamma
MSNLRQIRRRILTAGNIAKITRAMEMVSASKMKRAQQQALASRMFSRAITESLQIVASRIKDIQHPLLEAHAEGSPVLIVFSPDRGLCGGLNSHIFKEVLRWGEAHPNGVYITLGKKATYFVKRMGWPVAAQFTQLPDQASPEQTLPIAELITEGFAEGRFSSVELVYMDFINTLSQHIKSAALLPLTEFAPSTAEEITDRILTNQEYILEPDAPALLPDLLTYYIENTLFQVLLESKASEHSARMVAMKNASNNAKELVSDLRLEYNKSRQAAITSELLDITTATLTIVKA